MRSTIVPVLAAALVAGGCDRQSTQTPQGEATAAASTDEVPSPPPDEAGGSAARPAIGSFDRSHAGEAAPRFGFADPSGKPTSLAAFRGKPVLVNLWATWCAPCVKEMPTLDALAAREGAKLRVVALSQDLDAIKMATFWQKGGYRALKPYRDAQLAFSTGLGANLPTTILYDSSGKEVWRLSGDFDWASDAAKTAIDEAA